MRVPRFLRRAAALALAAALTAPGFAQDDGARAAREREREALRRSQSALRQSLDQAASLAKEKSDVAAERDRLGETVRRVEAQLSASRDAAARRQADTAKLAADLAEAKAAAEASDVAAKASIAALNARLADAMRRGDERTQANTALTALLEKSTRALAAAEKSNERMHALGLQLIEQIRSGSPGTVSDPVIGFGQVRLENVAEGLRDQLEAARTLNRGK